MSNDLPPVPVKIEMHAESIAALRRRWNNPYSEAPALQGYLGMRGVPLHPSDEVAVGSAKVTYSDGNVKTVAP